MDIRRTKLLNWKGSAVVQLVYFIFNAYALGLVVYVVCPWVGHEKTRAVAKRLDPFYAPILERIRHVVKPLKLGTAHIDITPMILLFGIVVARKVIMWILLTPY